MICYFRPIMLTATLGKIVPSVSRIGFGAASISGEGGGYGFGAIDETSAIELLHRAKDAGINLFDTAPIYGFGTSELRIGKAFRSVRDDVFVVSKSGVAWDQNKRVRVDNDPKTTVQMLDESLDRLGFDFIDLYMIHWPDKNIDIRKPMEVLSRAKQQGKIRYIGLSNTNVEDLSKALEVDRVDACQGEFNLFNSTAKKEIFPACDDHGIGFMSWGTLDKGILTGRVNRTRERQFDKDDARSKASWWTGVDREPKYLAMDEILPLLDENTHSGLELAIGFCLKHPTLVTALCGARSFAQLDSTVSALENLPSEALIEQCAAIVARVCK